ncbi:MAG: ABC transporter ATP-binding protein [Deltaproteobacteria bacterium]|nr:ABC transporter ATP-binding protein [Deltaproteobacteria bacterium]
MLEARRLVKVFVRGHLVRQRRRVIDDVSLCIGPSETVGLVGCSGAGKSTLGKLLTRLLEPTSGQLLFRGTDITHARERELRSIRRKVQIVFQHPHSALHPGMKIADLLKEPLRLHRLVEKQEQQATVMEMLARVGLHTDVLHRYPAEVSGGEIQRVVIARVMALKPCLVVLDEPTSMLDISIQAGIFQVLTQLQQETGVSYLLISHDLKIVERLCCRVAVMEHGRIVEQGEVTSTISPTRRNHGATGKCETSCRE